MLKYRTLQRILAALLLVRLLPSAGLTALAEEYYWRTDHGALGRHVQPDR